MPAESQASVQLQIGHVLFMDLAGYSTLLLDQQRQSQKQLTEIVANGARQSAAQKPYVPFFHAFSRGSGLVSIHV